VAGWVRRGEGGRRWRRWRRRLLLQQQRGQAVQRVAVAGEQLAGGVLGLAQQAGDLGVDEALGGIGVLPAAHLLAAEVHRRARAAAHRAERGGQAELAHHPGGEVGRAGQIVRRAGGALAEDEHLRRPAAQAHRQGVAQVALGVQVALVDGQLLGHAQRHARGQDRDHGHRVGVVAVGRHQRVAGLVDRDRALLGGQQHVGALAAAQDDAVARLGEVVVAQVLAAGALGLRGRRDDDLAVEAAGAQQPRVERLGNLGAPPADAAQLPGDLALCAPPRVDQQPDEQQEGREAHQDAQDGGL